MERPKSFLMLLLNVLIYARLIQDKVRSFRYGPGKFTNLIKSLQRFSARAGQDRCSSQVSISTKRWNHTPRRSAVDLPTRQLSRSVEEDVHDSRGIPSMTSEETDKSLYFRRPSVGRYTIPSMLDWYAGHDRNVAPSEPLGQHCEDNILHRVNGHYPIIWRDGSLGIYLHFSRTKN